MFLISNHVHDILDEIAFNPDRWGYNEFWFWHKTKKIKFWVSSLGYSYLNESLSGIQFSSTEKRNLHKAINDFKIEALLK